MDVTAFVALLDQLDSADGALLDRLGPDVPERVRRMRGTPAVPARARTAVHQFAGDEPSVRTWRLTGAHVACLVEGAAPAHGVLKRLRRLAPGDAWAYVDGTRGLAALLAARLGANPAAWRFVQDNLAEYPGLLPELVEAAGRMSGDDRPLPAAPRRITAEFRQLLMLLDPGTLAALVPHLHRRTVTDLARFGADLPRETVAWVVALASPKERLTLARARWSRPDVAEALAALDDPDVTTAVYVNRHTSVAVRARIMARATAVPEGIADCVLDSDSRAMRLPALWSGDPALVRAALLYRSFTSSTIRHSVHVWRTEGYDALQGLYTPIDTETGPQRPLPLRAPRYRALMLAALVRLWERHGVAEAAKLADEVGIPPRDRALYAELFAAEDGLARLRAELAAKSGTKVLLKRLRGYSPTKLWPLIENPEADWAVVAKSGGRLSGVAWTYLGQLPGCPPRPLPDAAGPDGDALVGAGRWPAAPEVHVPREWTGSGYVLAQPARHGAPLPPEHLFADVAPAATALNTFGCLDELMAADGALLRYREHLGTLVDRHLGASTEARAVALRLLADFTGTTEELLATAGAMTLVAG